MAVRISLLCLWALPALAALLAAPSAVADRIVDGVPLPDDARVVAPAASLPAGNRRFLGAWTGTWGDDLRHILIVEEVRPDASARVIYAVGENASGRVKPQWGRLNAAIRSDTLTIESTFTVVYRLDGPDRALASWRRGSAHSSAVMARTDLGKLLSGPAVRPRLRYETLFAMLDTDLREGGRLVRLELVLARPEGAGPFPLLLFNHGSTGRGNDPSRFGETWWSREIAAHFASRGWMVAFPQRRGRGKSDGAYEEGFASDRARGYACEETERSLAGFDRALADIDAALTALTRRVDVDHRRVVVGGLSRGGILSVAFAGRHPERVAGVINFVGGWLGSRCSKMGVVNPLLFERGARFSGPTLWLYGKDDPFYPIAHSRANFERFRSAGGSGAFHAIAVPRERGGHWLTTWPHLWSSPVDAYIERTVAR